MAGYIGKVLIGTNEAVLVGSTLYGICKTAASTGAKTVTSTDDDSGKFINNNYDNLILGSTIHVKFLYGNTVTDNVTLKVGTILSPKTVRGNCTCPPNTIISFTYDENELWTVNDNVDNNTTYEFAEGTTNGAFTVSVDGATATAINIHGLGGAAYKNASTTITNGSTDNELASAAAVYSYVQQLTGGLAGLTGAMHFRGIATTAVTDGGVENPEISTYTFGTDGENAVAGDVVIWDNKEYVWTGLVWELLGDEGSYALKSNTDTITEVTSFTANLLPSLTITDVTIPILSVTSTLDTTAVTIPNVTLAGIATTASVNAGILTITLGRDTTLGTSISITAVNSFVAEVTSNTSVTIGSASGWSAGTTATLSTVNTTVVVPGTT